MLKYRKMLRRPLPLRYVLLLTFIFFTLFTGASLWVINRHIEPHLMKVAEIKTRQITAKAVNEAMSKEVTENIDITQLIVEHNTSGETGYSFNPKVYNKVIDESTRRVQQYLNIIETGEIDASSPGSRNYKKALKSLYPNGIIYYIPLGMATDNALFANVGPKIPVEFEMIGDVTSDIDTKATEVGINNTFLEVYVNVKVRMNVIIPLSAKETTIVKKVKIGDLFLPGKVPQYYNGGGQSGLGITIPGN